MATKKAEKAIPVRIPEVAAKSTTGTGPFIDHIKKINDIYYDQIRIADQKAAYIFTFMLAFMISSAEGRGVFSLKRYSEGTLIQAGTSAVLALAVVVSLVSAILVVLPRHLRTAPTSLYWGVWPAKRVEYLRAWEVQDADYLRDEYLGNADNLSEIARRKYRYVALAFRGLVVTVLAYVLLLLAT